jgi:hypothetical protein
MEFKIVVIHIAQGESQGWQVQVFGPEGLPLLADDGSELKRVLRQDPFSGFPLPSLEEIQRIPLGALHKDLCLGKNDGLKQLHNSFLSASKTPMQDIEKFGRYLFSILFGEHVWEYIRTTAGNETIELALMWDKTESFLNQLPWEAMHDTTVTNPSKPYEGFLSTLPNVSIFRRIIGVNKQVTSLNSPPRVLFVIGTEPDDPVVRPGAEYLGLLRSLEQSGAHLETHLLYEANIESLHKKVDAFLPDVVHIISHGNFSEKGAVLELRDTEDYHRNKWVNASDLADALRNTDGHFPAALVMNACSTAVASDAELGRSMAVELVQEIPVVVGMAGPVTDQACRLFVRGFYNALLQDSESAGDVVRAASAGRRAALRHGNCTTQDGGDWFMPSLLLSSDQPIRLPITPAKIQAERQMAARDFTPPSFPPFCDRVEFFKMYDDLVHDTRPKRGLLGASSHQKILAISVPHQDSDIRVGNLFKYGRTWLLRMFAAQALRDGHVPILVSHDLIGGGDDYPRESLDDYLMWIRKAATYSIQRLRKTTQHGKLFWKPKLLDSLINYEVGQPLPNEIASDEDVQLCFHEKDSHAKDVLLSIALRKDLMDLLQAVREQRPETERASVRIVLLLDDLHRLGAIAGSVRRLLDSPGIFEAFPDIITVFTYSNKPTIDQNAAVEILGPWVEKTTWIMDEQLDVFHAKPEDLTLAGAQKEIDKAAIIYNELLLGWSDNKCAGCRPLYLVSKERAKDIYLDLMDNTEGIPSRFRDELPRMIRIMIRHNDLQDANDEDALEALAHSECGR